ncbi:hypothetical protein AOLI_G00077580 [Acnodon oligacanthus]
MKTIMLCMILLLVLHIQPTVSQKVPCFASFSLTDGTCSDILGELTIDDCCLNSKYGYQEGGVCKSCRTAQWSEWSPWSECSVSCMEGVQQRRRACYGIGRCYDVYRKGSIQTKPCEDRHCCPENGGWSEWSSWFMCSVTCGSGIKKRNRKCTEPPPKCGGSCLGDSEETAQCDTGIVCPTHGSWSLWGSWGPCMGTCQDEGFPPPEQHRRKTCTNPPPSMVPRGNNCPGSDTDSQPCTELPFCKVNGNWGNWGGLSPCSVTCGVGRQMQYRKCDNPAPKYGGQWCQGEDTRNTLCNTNVYCPFDGHWNDWGQWSPCKSPNERPINCKNKQGHRRRERDCIGRHHNGEYCPGEGVEHSTCYDIDKCPDLAVSWSEWSSWSLCKPDCGRNSVQKRKKECLPDISTYSEKNLEMFVGTPTKTCQPSATEEARACINLPEC